jgi:hypothetical protein
MPDAIGSEGVELADDGMLLDYKYLRGCNETAWHHK